MKPLNYKAPKPQVPMRDLQILSAELRAISSKHPELKVDIANRQLDGIPNFQLVVSFGDLSSLQDGTPDILWNKWYNFKDFREQIARNFKELIAAFDNYAKREFVRRNYQ